MASDPGGLIAAKFGDLTNLEEQIRTANAKLASLGADTLSFTQGAEAAAWESDDFLAKHGRIKTSDDWVQAAAVALHQTERALAEVQGNFRGLLSRNVGLFT
jgi:hypothetical protein